MSVFVSVLFWVGVVVAADGSLALIFEENWQKIARGINIRRLAVMEIAIGFFLLAAHFVWRSAW
jgi:hypothetical protein